MHNKAPKNDFYYVVLVLAFFWIAGYLFQSWLHMMAAGVQLDPCEVYKLIGVGCK